ncbi:uncharacterized protein si:ch211-250c4.3 isoform X2 [Heterodontus francisci]|uniref:uncharacterized protein si:ch211-250c4.3 isoform X2 n=1 Tax=Heterodontus francisci TaxID=7792 RepID=UPI00355BD500
MMFGRNGMFGIGNSWKKVMRQDSSKRKVVLTKVTLLKSGSQCEDILSLPALAKSSNPEDAPKQRINNNTELVKSGFQNPFSEFAAVNGPSNCTSLKLYKSVSEDSGVEFPSGANSPSTPSGSEQSFVAHRRESSCDSGMAMSITSSSPALQHFPFPADCPNSEKSIKEDEKAEEQQEATLKAKKLPIASANWKMSNTSSSHFNQGPTIVAEEVTQPRHVSLVEIVIADTNSPPVPNDAMEQADEAQLDQETLKRRPSSDSLNDYMEECCRLSQVNQDKMGDRGSGLGYLEHICQLIETIGQLQDQNKQLLKQVWITERALKVTKLKEDFFLNRCSCGAVSVYQSLASLPNLQTSFTSNGNSFKPESTSQSIERLESFRSQAGEGDDTDSGGSERCKMPMCTTTVNGNEIDMKHDSDGTSNLNALQAHQKTRRWNMQFSGGDKLRQCIGTQQEK